MALFSRNVGGLDRAARLAAGVVLLATGLLLIGTHYGAGMTMTVLGVLALFTGLTRFCILYVPFGVSTNKPTQAVTAQASHRR